ncbi:RraA family protein [Verminephrobacter aporrectodeae subsp. tuberculatae]|uniref:RraA family protein n=1 Tax=Verminephrobacter aporrectodeae TaxID=1110389 RepID=UPI002244ECC8|nr:RraA family protein [Verminephrobacter aporrectodeae]MCW8206077.1 RraA family protein [Verminephrobacter aporrectodeae subsp. tuberculatae]
MDIVEPLLGMLKEARALGSAVVWDKAGGHAQLVQGHGLRNFTPELRLAGPVHLVQTQGDILPVLQGLKDAAAGSVLLIEDITPGRALLGDIVMLATQCKGLGGIVCLGTVRDVADASNLKLPLWAHSCSPVAASLGKPAVAVQAIKVGDTRFECGDWVFADQDGVVRVPKAHARLVIKAAAIKNKKEQIYKQRMLAGEDLIQMMNIDGHLQRGEPIRVEF